MKQDKINKYDSQNAFKKITKEKDLDRKRIKNSLEQMSENSAVKLERERKKANKNKK